MLVVEVDEIGRLREDDRLDDALDRLGDDLAYAVAVPASDQAQDRLPDLVQLLLARAEVEVYELGVKSPQHRALVDQAPVVKGSAEGNDRGFRDDGLVQVEKCRLERPVGGRESRFWLTHGLFPIRLLPARVTLAAFRIRISRAAAMATAVATATALGRRCGLVGV